MYNKDKQIRFLTVDEYCALAPVTPSHVSPLYMDARVPAVRAAIEQQADSTWPSIPWRSESSWLGWRQCQLGLEYAPAVTSSGAAKWARHEWAWLPDRHKDDYYLIGGATFNAIKLHSTFSTPDVLLGFKRVVKAILKVSL